MKKLVLSLSIVAACTLAASETEIKNEIENAKAKVAKINEEIKTLESQLPKPSYTLNAHAELGYIVNSGNTDTEAFNLDAKVKNSFDKHSLELSLLYQYGEENSIESKNKFLSELLYDYMINDRFSFNYLAGYKDDKFSGFNYQFYTGPGAKYKVMKTQTQELAFDGNILYAYDDIEDTYKDTLGNTVSYPFPAGSINQNDGYSDSYAAYRVQAVYSAKIRENLKFNQTLSYRSEFSDADNFFVYSKSSLAVKISDIFSAGVNYYVDYINEPAAGKTSTDRVFSFNLIADY
ncbi:DUF481 domain-containing protein [Sulfurimonas sp. CVO]|jgi:putative salt-induced outer membrane protein|uniref:DUF481 domain-containing protein n=1 Tax=Sulfurimonas sp. CVO TaxID=2283483 RepID=UPI00132F025F|nr:DUF481 domain-containing protein [Sulfurimonas sp. CVO]QHG92002.1 DUF481 domain-containing protein [Sulfurimonas sp. CVO]